MSIKQISSRDKDKLWHKGAGFITYQARKLVRESQIAGPPFLPEQLASFLGIRVVKESLGYIDSLLIPLRDGYEIRINATHPPERQNFSCAHEIAHTFFFQHEGRVLIEEITRENGQASDKWQEKLCNIAATELLMPLTVFRQYASRYDFCILSLQHLARVFNTSILATAYRLSSVSPMPCFVGFSTPDGRLQHKDVILSPTWSAGFIMRISSAGGKFSFCRKVSGRSSGILEAYRSGSPIYSQERMKLPNFVGLCNIESQGFGHEPYRYVVSLIFPEY